MSGVLNDYKNLNTIPALLSIVFAVASLYQFGGISEVHIAWFDYALSTHHAMLVSLGVLVVAFASSETKEFRNYEDWEKALIAAGPLLIVSHQYVDYVNDLIVNNEPTAGVLAFLIAVAAWGVAVR